MSLKTIRLTVALLAASGLWLACPAAVRAELPPSAYKHFQNSAPESLVITVDVVALRRSVTKEARTTAVKLTASIKEVKRTATGLRPGGKIMIVYKVTEHLQPWVGPGQVTIPDKGSDCPAYLEHDDAGTGRYRPAAGGYTFRKLTGE